MTGIERVGVVGCGLMGAGIAEVCARAGLPVTVVERDAQAARAALIDGLVDVSAADHWWLCGPHGMVLDAQKVLTELGVPRDRVHQELFFAGKEPAAVHRAEPRTDGPVSEVTVVLDGRSTTSPSPGRPASSTRPPASAPTCPSPARAASAAPAAPGSPRARPTCDATTRWNRPKSTGYVLTGQTFPVSDSLTVDFDS
jgi:ring-1,2-phenylacetyl-CoA epoxidase subunit PaaE